MAHLVSKSFMCQTGWTQSRADSIAKRPFRGFVPWYAAHFAEGAQLLYIQISDMNEFLSEQELQDPLSDL